MVAPIWDGILPPGRKHGLKRDKKSIIVNRCDPISAVQELIPERNWDELAATQWHKNKRSWFRYILDQDGIGSCLLKNTAVRMADGSEKPIQKVNALDRIITAEGNIAKVSRTLKRQYDGTICRLELKNRKHIYITPEHPLLLEGGYTQVGKTNKNAFVKLYENWKKDKSTYGKINDIRQYSFDGTVYNLEVENDNSYIAEGLGVHNCAAESAAGLKAGLDTYQNLPMIVYNPWSIYWNTSGGRDNGSVIGDNVEYIRDYGVCPEEVWPRSKGWRSEPSSSAKEIAKLFRIVEFFYVENKAQLVSALLQGFCVHGGYSGHAVVFVGYLGNGQLLFCNSWGNWGDKGFGTLALNSVYFPYGAYAYKMVHRWTPDQWSPKHNQEALARAVNKFVDVGKTRRGVWSDRYTNWRDDEYQKALSACGLSI